MLRQRVRESQDVLARSPVSPLPEPVPELATPGRPVPWESTAKVAFDRAVAAGALILLSPVMLLAAVAILLDDGIPILYCPRRVGQNGREFTLYKFRTMTRDADRRLPGLVHLNKGGDYMIRIPHDPRITKAGRWLRRLAIDELPQLVNVLRGEMSLVGPRPQSPQEVALYTPEQRLRLRPLPGITGLWQVSARHEVSFAQWVKLDLQYQERWSFWLDLKIILRTPMAVARGTGS